jgi:hypothetical protein
VYTAFSDAYIEAFPPVWCNPVKSSRSVRKRFTRRDIVDLFGTGESGMYPWTHSGKLSKNEMPGSVRQWTLVALVKKTSLYFDCWKTTDGLARAGYNMTWPAWALVQSQRYCVFINPIELYWITTVNKYFPPRWSWRGWGNLHT